MEPLPRLLIGSLNGEHLLVDDFRWEFAEATDYWDGNWLHSTISIQVGGFRGSFEALLRTDEFMEFREQLQPLYENLGGTAKFESMEPWLSIEVTGDGIGHFEANCQARDEPGMGNALTFSLAFDQTELPRMVRDLDELLRRFPVRGKRE